MPKFKHMPMHPDQILLFRETIEESVPADCDVRIISEVMDLLDWSAIENSYSEQGRPAYPPSVLAKVLAYAYNNGIRSSRKIEALVENDKRYIWLAGGLKPDFHTLARFRKDKQAYLVELFHQSVRLCDEADLVVLDAVSVDGTKIRARASKRSVYDQKRVDRQTAYIERILKEAEEQDKAEDERYGTGNGRELPEHLKSVEARRERLKKAQELLDKSDRQKVVLTEPESRVMKTQDKTYPCYNIQAAVDCGSQVIVAMDVVQNECDHGELVPMIEKVQQTLSRSAETFVADTGFCDEKTLLAVKEQGLNVLMPPQTPNKEKREPLFQSKCFLHDEKEDVLICPAGRKLEFRHLTTQDGRTYRVYQARRCQSCSFHRQCVSGRASRTVKLSIVHEQKQQMRERLKADEGQALYRQRGESVEPVFGNIKTNHGLDRFLLAGVDGAMAETALAFLIHNICKCISLPRERIAALKCA